MSYYHNNNKIPWHFFLLTPLSPISNPISSLPHPHPYHHTSPIPYPLFPFPHLSPFPLPSPGDHCELEINECASDPCQRNGTCHDLVNRFYCDCPIPYRGDDCSLLPCETYPCENGASCVDFVDDPLVPDGFLCYCPSGFIGKAMAWFKETLRDKKKTLEVWSICSPCIPGTYINYVHLKPFSLILCPLPFLRNTY